MSDSSRGKRRRTPSPEESRRDNRHKRKRSHSRRRENNSNHSSVNEALTQILASMQDMKKEFTAWTKRVDNIELQLNANSSVRQLIPDEDYLSVHPTASPFTSEEVDVPHDNGAIEAPLAGPEPPLADVESDYSHSNLSKERLDNHGPEQSCEFFDPEDTTLRKWSPSEPFRAFLEKNLKRRLTVDQVNEIIGENSLPETEACVAPYLDKQILNYVPNNRRKGVENRDKDLSLIQRALLNSAAPLCCLHDRLERKEDVSNEEVLTTLQQSLCLLGSANHITTITRRKKILGAINPDKIQLADNEFPNAGKMLFGEDLPPLAAKHSELSRSLSKNLQKPQYITQHSTQTPKQMQNTPHRYSYTQAQAKRPFRGPSGQKGPEQNNQNFRKQRDQRRNSWSRQ